MSQKVAREYRSWIRRQVGLRRGEIVVVPGATAPTVQGEYGYYTTPGGAPVRYPNAYRRAGGRPVYHCSTIRVEVGADWLDKRRIPAAALA